MRHIKLFEAFSTTSLTEDQKIWLDKCAILSDWKLNPSTGLIDVDGDFKCTGQGLKDFKGVAFGHVEGDFKCDYNQLTSLVGAPKTVNGNFNCGYNNQLTSLVEGPQTVGGSFVCSSNQLTSLVGAPLTFHGHFFCERNPLKSLEGAPERVGSFNISGWDSDPGISTLDWKQGWNKKGGAEFIKTVMSKLKKIEDLEYDKDKPVDKLRLKTMLLSMLGAKEISDYILSNNFSPSDKFEIYGAIKANIPDVWNKVKDQLDPDGATSDLMDLGF
jgi:hypothetical protein